MGWRRTGKGESFDWREVACADEAAAKAEAERQESAEDPSAEWIYLHNEETDQWLARRVPRDPSMYKEQTPLWEAFLQNLLP